MLAPKRKNEDAKGKESCLFDYYAAYSHAFVRRVLSQLNLQPDTIVLDPWNGRGTTTSVAAEMGVSAIGFDLNPAMVAIAEARLVHPLLAASALKRLSRRRGTPSAINGHAHAFEGWLVPKSASHIGAVRQLLEQTAASVIAQESHGLKDATAQERRLRAFLLLSLASALRQVMRPFQSSNPTWVKEQVPPHRRLRPTLDTIRELTLASVSKAVDQGSSYELSVRGRVLLAQADSRSLPLRSGSIDAIVTSPPYCTRIDYAVATRPELAIFFGPTHAVFRSLRDRLMGTTTVPLRDGYSVSPQWAGSCISTLEKIRTHSSKASATYYYRNFLLYFDALYSSLLELDRVAKVGCSIALVVQDSYYKEVHVDLATIITEMAMSRGWAVQHREDHRQAATLAASNPKSRAYRSIFSAVETVLHMKKGRESCQE